MEFRRLNNRKEVSLRKSNFKLSELIRDVAPVSNGTLTPYSNYIGSLTTPECSEVTLISLLDILRIITFQIVHWINFLRPLQMSSRQLAVFRQFADSEGHTMSDNYRPIQPLNNRKVVIYGPKY